MARQSVLNSVLKEKEFKEGDNQDQCPICLARFNPKEKICMLACQHRYHRACVEQWLTGYSRTCPVCRHNVLTGAQAVSFPLHRYTPYRRSHHLFRVRRLIPGSITFS